jgi:hypothetical protein
MMTRKYISVFSVARPSGQNVYIVKGCRSKIFTVNLFPRLSLRHRKKENISMLTEYLWLRISGRGIAVGER